MSARLTGIAASPGGRHRLAAITPRRRRRMEAGRTLTLNLVPMIDVVFNLLIFFLIGTRFIVAEGVLPGRLPRTTPEVADLPVPAAPVRVRLVAAEQNGCSIIIEDRGLRPADFEQLSTMLAQIQREPGFDEQTPIVLLVEPDVSWDHVVNAYNAALRAGYRNMVFGAE